MNELVPIPTAHAGLPATVALGAADVLKAFLEGRNPRPLKDDRRTDVAGDIAELVAGE